MLYGDSCTIIVETVTGETVAEKFDGGSIAILTARRISRSGGYKAHQEAAFRRSWLCAYNYRGFLLWYPGQRFRPGQRAAVLFALLRSHVPPRIPPHAIHD
ncbi:hypothetical protein ANTQUA_LOCUS4882 [Anthophora quadrimaculata]